MHGPAPLHGHDAESISRAPKAVRKTRDSGQNAVTLFKLSRVPFSVCHSALRAPLGVFIRQVQMRFVQSPYADYLFYILYRSTGQSSQLATVVSIQMPSSYQDPLRVA